MTKVNCTLCGMEFDTFDSLFAVRTERHSEFHGKARIQRRNTTQGVAEYI